MVVTSKSPVYSVLYLILTFFCLSGHYIILNAQFLAFVNIIVYAGAIMVLFLFVIMFLNMKEDEAETSPTLIRTLATGTAIVLGVTLVLAFSTVKVAAFNPMAFDSQVGMVKNLGSVLFREYLLPFELASVLFLIAMVGAVMLGRREAGDRHF